MLFLFPTILFFNYKRKIKISIFIIYLSALFTNYFWGNSNLRQFEFTEKKDLGFNIKIISPTININRYFQNENPSELILELINISKPNPSIETLFILSLIHI